MRFFIYILFSLILFFSMAFLEEGAYAFEEGSYLEKIEATINELKLQQKDLLDQAEQEASKVREVLLNRPRNHRNKVIKHNVKAQHHFQKGLDVIKKVNFIGRKIKDLEIQKAGEEQRKQALANVAAPCYMNGIGDQSSQICKENPRQIYSLSTCRRKKWIVATLGGMLALSPLFPIAGASAPVEENNQPCLNPYLQWTHTYINAPLSEGWQSSDTLLDFLQPPQITTEETKKLSRSFESVLECFQLPKACVAPEGKGILNVGGDRVSDFSIREIKEFYKDVRYVNRGSESVIFKATLAQGRKGINAGEQIAIRLREGPGRFRHVPMAIQAYAKLEVLRNQQISCYIPVVYGFYYAPFTSDFNFEYYSSLIPEDGIVSYTEMELMDTTFDKEYAIKQSPVTPRVVCEQLLGEWAKLKIAKIHIGDDQMGQYGLKWDANYLVYHIGRKTYLFEPGFSPRRLDLDTFFSPPEELIKTAGPPPCSIWYREDIQSNNLKNLCQEIQIKGLFKAIEDNLTEFEVSEENPIPKLRNVKHLYISEEDMKL